MPIIPIPLLRGTHEEVDAKLLPDGALTVAQNVRFAKQSRVRTRNAFVRDGSGPTANNVIGSGAYGPKHDVAITARSTATPATATRHEYGQFSQVSFASSSATFILSLPTGSLGVPSLTNSGRGLQPSNYNVMVDTLVDNTLTFVVYSGYQFGTATTGGLLVAHDTDTGAILGAQTVESGMRNAKIVKIGTSVCVFYTTSANLNLVRFAAFTANINLSVVTAAMTCVTASTNRAPYFDVSPGGSASEAYLVYQSANNVVSFGTVSSVGVFALLATINTTNNPAEARCAISPTFSSSSTDIIIAINDGAAFNNGNIGIAVYRRGTGFTTAYTAATASNLCIGYPVVGPDQGSNWYAFFNEKPFSIQDIRDVGFFTSSLFVSRLYGLSLASKPFAAQGTSFVLLCDADAAPSGTITTRGKYFAVQAGLTLAETHFAIDTALPTDEQSTLADPRRRIMAATTTGYEPGITALVGAVPLGSDTDAGYGLVRMEPGNFAEMLQPARLNGQLFFSGPQLTHYDGQTLEENAFPMRPVIMSATPTIAGGSVAAGTYQYVAVYEWRDALGYRHLSEPSLPITAVVGGGNNAVVIYVAGVQLSVKGNSSAINTAFIRVYRTQAGGNIFQDVLGYGIRTFGSGTSFTDIATDASIATSEIIYTQGERGGLSGIHENNLPPPCRYAWAGSDRIIIGGLDQPNQVQWSKLRFDGEPITWANDPQWRATVDGRVSAVGEMDGIYFIGTREAIWTVGGQGPEDDGSGSFDAPQRLPSDVGILSGKSLVRAATGLFFQGATDRIYRIPRGGGAPEWIGQPIRDTLAAFPYVSAAVVDADSGLIYWAICDSAASAGRLLVYDTTFNEWSVDSVQARAIKTLSIYDGKLVIDGSIIESASSYQDDDGSTTANVLPILTTGDMRAFGQNGWGRYKKIQILGEARDVSVAWSLTAEISYDSGKTFGETATWTRASLATAIGDAISGADHAFVIQRCNSVRIRLSLTTPSPTEGLVFNGFQLEVYPADGSKRQASAMRAA